MNNVCATHALIRPIVMIAFACLLDFPLRVGVELGGKFCRVCVPALNMLWHRVVEAVERPQKFSFEDGLCGGIIATANELAV